jgi:hypothetical protein
MRCGCAGRRSACSMHRLSEGSRKQPAILVTLGEECATQKGRRHTSAAPRYLNHCRAAICGWPAMLIATSIHIALCSLLSQKCGFSTSGVGNVRGRFSVRIRVPFTRPTRILAPANAGSRRFSGVSRRKLRSLSRLWCDRSKPADQGIVGQFLDSDAIARFADALTYSDYPIADDT